MNRKPSDSTASIEKDGYCKDCGWPLIFACCNDEMRELHPMEDWWMYCSNQGCKNHVGEPYGQHNIPEFMATDAHKKPLSAQPD